MDFLTGAAYWVILLVVIVNACWVRRLRVDLGDDDDSTGESVRRRER